MAKMSRRSAMKTTTAGGVAAVGQPVRVGNHDPVGFHFRVDPARSRKSA